MDKNQIDKKIKELQKENQKKAKKREKIADEDKKLHLEIMKNISEIEKLKKLKNKSES
ncbi:hypothetical protein [Pseudoleptotrichia goodfellowii]|uniref:Uncharacterized protein n=1 Tax=Pseudoleptotrichia goodfellowii F0264 TaxID=596323 RepID=D0GNZ6_9FUSO|nr:hypothetical protein [Pseudoleptotrichia goodfellowii]EEY34190.1 hypothetical protein HMPREF0554_0849 [Pseudoleptotrichia goodfellowii F0264]